MLLIFYILKNAHGQSSHLTRNWCCLDWAFKFNFIFLCTHLHIWPCLKLQVLARVRLPVVCTPEGRNTLQPRPLLSLQRSPSLQTSTWKEEDSAGQWMGGTLGLSYHEMLSVVWSLLYIRQLPLADVLGQSGGLLWVFSQQSLIAWERLHQAHIVGQRHGPFHPHAVIPRTNLHCFVKSQGSNGQGTGLLSQWVQSHLGWILLVIS